MDKDSLESLTDRVRALEERLRFKLQSLRALDGYYENIIAPENVKKDIIHKTYMKHTDKFSEFTGSTPDEKWELNKQDPYFYKKIYNLIIMDL